MDSTIVWNDRLYHSHNGFINLERKTNTASDYQDGAGEAIQTAAEWTTIHDNTPDKSKQFAETNVLFKEAPRNIERRPIMNFSTEQSTQAEFVPLHFTPLPELVGFSRGNYGQQPFGSPNVKDEAVSRTYVPRNKQKASLMHLGLDHLSYKDKMELTGVSLKVRQISGRTDR